MTRLPETSKLVAQRQLDTETESETEFEPSLIQVSAPDPQPSQIELLLKTVEAELIPRLFVNHMMDVPVTSPLVENRATEPKPGPWCNQKCVETFAALCIGNDPVKLDEHVTDLLAQGITLESIFLYLLTPVAQLLGERWTSDDLSFVDVQMGLCRLHQLICECETIGYWSENNRPNNQSILLSCAPGEDHTFGVTMVADFFRRYGWQVSNFCGLETDFLLERMGSTHYTAVGFSLHNQDNYLSLKTVIERVKRKAINKELFVMVGGEYFIQHPGKAIDVGADIFATDGHQAVLQASNASKRSRVEV